MSSQRMQSQQVTIIPMETFVKISRQTGFGNRHKPVSSQHSSHNIPPSQISPKSTSNKAKCHDNACYQDGVSVQVSDRADVYVMIKVDAVDLTECEGPNDLEEAMKNMGSTWVGTYLKCPIKE